jgi:hypothetical protein
VLQNGHLGTSLVLPEAKRAPTLRGVEPSVPVVGGLEFQPRGDADDRDAVGEVVFRRVRIGVIALDGVGRDLRDGGGRFGSR